MFVVFVVVVVVVVNCHCLQFNLTSIMDSSSGAERYTK